MQRAHTYLSPRPNTRKLTTPAGLVAGRHTTPLKSLQRLTARRHHTGRNQTHLLDRKTAGRSQINSPLYLNQRKYQQAADKLMRLPTASKYTEWRRIRSQAVEGRLEL